MAVQGVDGTARQRLVLREKVGEDLLFGKATVEKYGDRPGDELAQLAIVEKQRGDRLRTILAIHHQLARIDEIMDLRHRDTQHLRNIRKRQQVLAGK